MKRFIGIFIVLALCLSANVVFAYYYSIKSNLPGIKTFLWYTHNSCTSAQKTLARTAAATWNNARTGMTLSCNSVDSSGGIVVGDTRSDYVWVDYATISGVDQNAAGTTISVGRGYKSFDMLLNSNSRIQWCDDSTDNKVDRQGVITHEFGHVLGLADVYISDYTLPHFSVLPTMFWTNYYQGSLGGRCNNCAYYLRSLEQDDIFGVQYGVVPLILNPQW